MPDISGSALLGDARTWIEGAAGFAGIVIWTIWRKATQAGDDDRHKPSPTSIGGTGVALLADSNPIRELTTIVEFMAADLKGLRAEQSAARKDEDGRRQEADRETARILKDENRAMAERLKGLETGQTKTHSGQGEVLSNQTSILDGLAEMSRTIAALRDEAGPYEATPRPRRDKPHPP